MSEPGGKSQSDHRREASDERHEAARPRLVILALAVSVLAIAAFGPSLGGGFIFDDHPLIETNLYIHSFGSWSRWFTTDFWDVNEEIKMWGFRLVYWRPAVTASYALDWQLGRGSPVLFHMTNLVEHGIVAFLAVYTLRRWIGAPIPAVLAALVFALHPTKGESVAWIAGRTDVLCAIAMLLACAGCARRLRRERGGLALEAVATVLAYMTKEQAITLPAFVAVEAWVFMGRPPITWRLLRDMARPAFPQLVLAVTYLGIRAVVMPVVPAGSPSLLVGEHIAQVFETAGRYVALTFWPHDLSIQQGLVLVSHGQVVRDSVYIAVGVISIVVLLTIVVAMRRSSPGTSVGVALYMLMLLPTSNIVSTHMVTLLSERFLYLPVLGLCLAFGFALDFAMTEKKAYAPYALIGSAVAIVALGVGSARRANDFSDEEAFWEREYALHPASLEAIRYKLAEELENKNFTRAVALSALGQNTAAEHYRQKRFECGFILRGIEAQLFLIPDHDRARLLAIAQFLNSAIDPRASEASFDIGTVAIRLPLDKAARAAMTQEKAKILALLAAIASRQGEDRAALERSSEALTMCPGCLNVSRVAALAAARAGEYDRAHVVLSNLAAWTNDDTVQEQRTVIETAHRAAEDGRLARDPAVRLQLRATELATLDGWGRAFDVLAPHQEAIQQAPDFALGFAELAWRAGEFQVARDVLSRTSARDTVESTTLEWSKKMGWPPR